MYHSNSPHIIEIPDDIDRIEAMNFTPGENNRVTVTFVLKDSKTFINPTMLFATNGVESRLLAPTITLTERIADDPIKDTPQPVETPQIESQPQEEAKAETPKKSRKKVSDGGGEA